MKQHVPNTITCLNLFAGCVGTVFCFNQNLEIGALCIFIAAVLDFFDGMFARLLNAHSAIGKDLDSLADMVSFGFLPASIIYQLFLKAPQIEGISIYLNFTAYLIAIFSALRLAKFNIDQRQTDSFIGLPTPANALLIASLPFIINDGSFFIAAYIKNPFFLLCFSMIMSLLLIAELPLLSLKFKNLQWQENIYRYILIIVSVICLLIFKFAAIPIIIFFYITLSIIQLKSAR